MKARILLGMNEKAKPSKVMTKKELVGQMVVELRVLSSRIKCVRWQEKSAQVL